MDALHRYVKQVLDPKKIQDLISTKDGQALSRKRLLGKQGNRAFAVACSIYIRKPKDDNLHDSIRKKTAIHFAGGLADAVCILGRDGRGFWNGQGSRLAVNFTRR